jgi:hypothetical protein
MAFVNRRSAGGETYRRGQKVSAYRRIGVLAWAETYRRTGVWAYGRMGVAETYRRGPERVGVSACWRGQKRIGVRNGVAAGVSRAYIT